MTVEVIISIFMLFLVATEPMFPGEGRVLVLLTSSHGEGTPNYTSCVWDLSAFLI